jgi:60 kDa SS-A/Ro ribonucleoprotein
MAKYNTKKEPTVKKAVTHQGGVGYTQTPENELVGMLATGLDNTYYEKENERTKRFADVFGKIASKNKTFAAKSLIYARTKFGQRSISHFGAVELIPFLQGDSLGKRFFSKRNKKTQRGGIIYRLDDMAEILAAYLEKNGQEASIPNSIKKGFKDAIENADAYELAKYQMKNRGVSLVDIVNLVHPRETARNGSINVPMEVYLKAVEGTKFQNYAIEGAQSGKNGSEVNVPTLRALVLGILKQFNTVEDKNTEAGKEVAEKVKAGIIDKEEAAKVLIEKKSDNYKELIKNKTIGYLALIRNLRNIIKTGDTELLDEACKLVVNKDFIRKSLVFPHQIDLALEIMLIEFSGSSLGKISKALDIAYENSIPNLKELFPYGKSAIVYDTSGSMQGGWGSGCQIPYNGKGKKINSSPLEKASLVAATFTKGINGDVYHFGTSCQNVKGFNPNDSINTLKRYFISQSGKAGHGTYYQNIFPELERVGGKYDRIFIMTDEQGADSVEKTYKEYCNKFGTPHVYFINLCGYGSTMMKQNTRVHRIFGYNSDIYELAKKTEIDPIVVIKEINAIEI